jgi:hypothetical protein
MALPAKANTPNRTHELFSYVPHIFMGSVNGWCIMFERWLVSVVKGGRIGMNMAIPSKKEGGATEIEWVHATPPHRLSGDKRKDKEKKEQAQIFLEAVTDALFQRFETVLGEAIPSQCANMIFCISGMHLKKRFLLCERYLTITTYRLGS